MKSKGSNSTGTSSGSKNLVAIFVILGLGVGIYKFVFDKEKESISETQEIKRLGKREDVPIQYPEDSPYKSDGTTKSGKTIAVKKPTVDGNIAEIQKIVEQRKIAQEQLRESFKSELQLKAKLPENLHYSQLDLDDGITGLRGTGKGAIEDLTILATKIRVDEKSVASYLNSGDTGVPVARGLTFNPKPVMKLNPPAGKGLGTIKILESNNPRVKAAFIPRSDNQGSYLFILDAETSLYESNEGLLENLLGHLEAQ